MPKVATQFRSSNKSSSDPWTILKTALANDKRGLRTVDGLVRETRLTKQEVLRLLNEHKNEIRASYVTDSSGRSMYTLKSNSIRPREIWATVRAFATAQP